MPGWIDHLFVFLACVAYPAYAAWFAPQVIRDLLSGRRRRVSEYREVIVTQWLAAIALVAAWIFATRAPALLGFAVPAGWRLWVTVLVPVAAVAFFWMQYRTVVTQSAARAMVRGQLDAQPAVAALIPRDAQEKRTFCALAITAGVCEEVIYRGFLLWYLASYLNTWAAVAVAVVVFGAAHAYQGTASAIRAGVAGAAVTGLYVATGSLIAPMLLHATMDVGGGLTAALAFEKEPPAVQAPTAQAA